MRYLSGVLLVTVILSVAFFSCKYEHAAPAPTDGNYPPEIAKIFISKCATAGCHNAASYQNANGLLMDTWEHLFKGGNSGSVIVPYSTSYSSLLSFINTDVALGPVSVPAMPLNAPALSKEEYLTVKNWIINGAPDKNGNIAFATQPDTRQKIYITQQGCDAVAVIDGGTQLIMRYIQVGVLPNTIESPHNLHFSPDGKYAYICYANSTYLQKIDAARDTVIASVDLNITGQQLTNWGTLHVSPDGQHVLVTYFDGVAKGAVVSINTNTMTIEQRLGSFEHPHGIANTLNYDTLFVNSQYGNVVYKYPSDFSFIPRKVSLDGNAPTFTQFTQDPHDIIMSPDYSKYFVSCQSSNQLRVMDTHHDTLIKVINIGLSPSGANSAMPQEIAISKSMPYLLVTCVNDISTVAGFLGSVYVINYNTYQVVKRIDGLCWQPHGITVDDKNGVFYVVSRNYSSDGPAPHHSSVCGGRNGWYNIYSIHTLEPINTHRYEMSADAYSADTRFK
jgi:DNA-binding beta-propeller fold protein YncE